MYVKALFHWFLVISVLLMTALFWSILSISPVSAQCGTPPKSSCLSCHAQVDHLAGMGEWNKIHLNQDMCTNCHGGNGSTMDKDLAHAGMVVQPLSDIYTDCHSCHPIDYTTLSAQFAATLNVTPGSCATPTPVPMNNVSGGPSPGGITTGSHSSSATIQPQPFLLIAGGLATLIFFFLGLGWLGKHRLGS